ncbi:MAG: carboxypeptidase regulatory-like domain-containing protein [Bacteroidetes bacterium]|nr:carboxypeptidase regulatory-like domain-containing protein [Bacteroidota bacterium]
MKNPSIFYSNLFILLLFLLPFSCKEAPSDAPELVSKITGKVTDGKTNSPLTGVQITTNPVTSSVITGQDGNYTISGVSTGQYVVTAKKSGYNDNTTNVNVVEGKTVNADIQLIEEGSELQVSTLTLDYDTGLTNLTFTITNKTKVGTVTWQAEANQPWVTVSPKNGTTTSESDVISVSISRTDLAYGNYSGLISVSSDYGSKQISVVMVVQNPSAPQLSVIPTTVDFGTANNNQIISVKNTGTGNLNWTASASVSWILVSKTSGTTTSNSPTNLTVSVNKSGLTANNYEGLLLFESNGGNQSILVKMAVESGTLNAPTLQLIGTPSKTSIGIGWTKITDSNFGQYKIFRSIIPGVTESSTLVTTVTQSDANTFTDNNLSNGTAYYYRVFVYNKAGVGSGSNEVSASTQKQLGTWVATTTIPNVSYSYLTPNSLFALSETDVWFVFSNEIWHYNGTSWSKNFTITGGSLGSVWAINSNLVYAIGSSGTIYKYNGVTWSKVTTTVIGTSNLYDMVATSDKDIWVSGYSAFFHFDGTTWTKFSVSASYIVDMDIISSDNIWATDNGGTIFKYNSVGWALIEGINKTYFSTIQAISNNDVWVSNNYQRSGLFHYDGNSFSGDYKLSSGSTYSERNTIEMISSNEGWSSFSDYTKLSYFDGNQWSDVTSPISSSVYCIKMLNSKNGWAVGGGGQILRYKE